MGFCIFWKRWVWWVFVLWVLLGCGLWVCVVEVFGFLLRLWFVLGRFSEFGYGFVWVRCLIFRCCGLDFAWL